VNNNQPMDLDHNQIMKHIICHNDYINFDIMVDAPSNFLIDSIASPKGENNERIMSWGTLPGLQHFGGKGARWNFGMGTRESDKQVNYSHGLAQTKQQID
jgi:hypothetical protein